MQCRGTEKRLLISYKKPFSPVSVDTVARWLQMITEQAGVDTKQFQSHSTRAAAVSSARETRVPINKILLQAGWHNEQMSEKFYKPLLQTSKAFSDAILEA